MKAACCFQVVLEMGWPQLVVFQFLDLHKWMISRGSQEQFLCLLLNYNREALGTMTYCCGCPAVCGHLPLDAPLFISHITVLQCLSFLLGLLPPLRVHHWQWFLLWSLKWLWECTEVTLRLCCCRRAKLFLVLCVSISAHVLGQWVNAGAAPGSESAQVQPTAQLWGWDECRAENRHCPFLQQ